MEKRKNINFLHRLAMLLVLLTGALTLQAQTSSYWVNGIRYEIDSPNDYYWEMGSQITLRVAQATGSTTYSGDIVIPETVKVNVARYEGSDYGGNYDMECRVTAIGDNAFRNCTGLTSVQLPKSIKTIGQNAFYGCTGLTQLTIPNGVSSIGDQAFGNCSGLTSMVLPNSVTGLGWNAFYSCTGLRSVTLSRNLQTLNGTFLGCTGLTTVSVPARVRTMDNTFKNCTSLTSVSLPMSLLRIGESAFEGCNSLSYIYLPNRLAEIGKRAFCNTGLTSLELPDGITSLGMDAFLGSTQLTTITSRNLNPPTMSNQGVFDDDIYAAAMLYIPAFDESPYSGADWWKLFTHVEGKSSFKTHYDFEAGGIYYQITGSNTVDVTYKDTNYNSYSGNVTIPASVTHDGVTYNVTAIGSSAFKNCTALSSVSLPETITAILASAFYCCTGLTAINLPEALTIIDDGAFLDCSGLTSLTIPINVTTIGNIAFLNTTGLTSLTWNARECWTKGGMVSDGITSLTIGDEVEVVPDNLAYSSQITTLALPPSVKYIGQYAFGYCYGLTSLTIPQNVIDIGLYAFYQTTGLTSLTWNARECWTNGSMYTNNVNSLTIGNDVKILPQNFAQYSEITTLSIPESVTTIGANAFNRCTGLTSVVIPDNVTYIGYEAFCECDNLNELTMGKSVATIDAYGFWRCPIQKLTWNARNVKIDVSDEYYDKYRFNETYPYHSSDYPNVVDYSSLTQLTIGDEVEAVPNYFAYGSRLTSVQIPASVTAIGDYAFASCSSLSNAQLPAGLISIGNGAFQNCTAMSNIALPGSLTTIGAEAFTGCVGITNLSVPASVTSFGHHAFFDCSGLESIVVDAANPVYDSRENCNAMFKTANDSIVLVCKNTTLPASMTIIPDSAFYGQTTLINLDIPSTVTSIGKDAFNACSNLTSITIPASVTHIGERAFAYCDNLTSLTVEEGNPVYDSRGNCNAVIEKATSTLTEGSCTTVIPSTVTTIGKQSFLGRSPGSVVVPDGVVTIEDSAFHYSSVQDLTLGNTLKTIGNYAFFISKLSSVVIPDCVETIGERAFSNCTSMCSATIGDGVTTMGKAAFASCPQLTRLTLGHALEEIPEDAFNYCYGSPMTYPPIEDYSHDWWYDHSGYYGDYYHIYYDSYNRMVYIDNYYGTTQYTLEEYEEFSDNGGAKVFIPENVKSIGKNAFNNCRGLNVVEMAPNSVVSIGEKAFFYCTSLHTVVIPPSLKSAGSGAFEYTSNVNVKISDLPAWCDIDFDGLSSTPFYEGGHLFLNDEEIVNLVVPEGLTAIKPYGFYGCTSIKSVMIGNSVKSIERQAFQHCDSLKSVNIGDGVETIGFSAFSYCYRLKTLNLGRALKTIDNMAFYYDPIADITSLAVIPPTITVTNNFTCYNTANLHVPEISVQAYRTAENWKKFTHIVVIPGAGPGDFNGDGVLNVSDVNLLINAIMNDAADIETYPNADVNGDGQVNISDVTYLISSVLNAE